MCSGFDITESKLAELEKQEALDRLQKIASSLPGCVYQLRMRADGTFRYPYVSEGVRDIFRLEAEDVREDVSKLFALHHPDDEPALLESIAKSARELTPWSHEFRIRFDDGTGALGVGQFHSRARNGRVDSVARFYVRCYRKNTIRGASKPTRVSASASSTTGVDRKIGGGEWRTTSITCWE